MQIQILKTLDKLIGVPLTLLLGCLPRRFPVTNRIKRILIIRPGGMGDAVLLLPMINFVNARFPDALIYVLCERRNMEIFAMCNNVDRVLCYDKCSDLMESFQYRYDLVIDTEQWHRLSAVCAFMTRAPIRVGFGTNQRRQLLTQSVDYHCEDYEVKSFLRLLESITETSFRFDPNEPFLSVYGHVPEGLGLSQDDLSRLVCIFPGASIKERRWGGGKFGAVALALVQAGYRVVIVGGHDDTYLATEIKNVCADLLDVTGRTTLSETAIIIKNSAIFISGDSGLMHLAYALGTPTVSLFGASSQHKWSPHGRDCIVINKNVECSPCSSFGYTPKCKHNNCCLLQIEPDEVIQACVKLLGS